MKTDNVVQKYCRSLERGIGRGSFFLVFCKQKQKNVFRNLLFLLFFCLSMPVAGVNAQQTALSQAGIHLIPYPKQVSLAADSFLLEGSLAIVLDKNASASDKFAAAELSQYLADAFAIAADIRQTLPPGKSIVLTRKGADGKADKERYTLKVGADRILVRSAGEAGLFYGVQTLIQLMQKDGARNYVRGMDIIDWPDTKVRAIHYDTKHHQDTRAYVESFIKDLARYKVNMLVWEWEDKFEYPSHPEIGAPGAFTMQEMQEITRYAKKFHIQITPLVQGLGHASFILKWPQHAPLREIAASNFEFCPLKEGTYTLLFDLWEDAIKATPGSAYIHIGSDETYELGLCAQCREKEKEISKTGIYHIFTARAAKRLQPKGRQVMVWERPMGWVMGEHKTADKDFAPQKGIVLTESYEYETPDLKYAREAKAKGYPVFGYDPNPGVEPLFLPYFFRKPRDFAAETIIGSLENSYNYLTAHLGKGVYDGVISTSWDDAGLHNQVWMLRFVIAAAYSWNASAPSLQEFTSSYFKNYYGNNVQDMERLFLLLNEGAIYYMEALERHVWHDKEIGKTHIPDLPRGDALEYNPFWNKEYSAQVKKSREMFSKMDEALRICRTNAAGNDLKNQYDFEIFQTIAELIKHTAQTFMDFSEWEYAIAEAHRQRILDHQQTYINLEKAEKIIQNQLTRRAETLQRLEAIWSKTRLPKGLSTNNKKYFFEQDRTVHFANRAPDMSYLIIDEQKLDLEGYLLKLRQYMDFYRNRFLETK